MVSIFLKVVISVLCVIFMTSAFADSDEDLAKQLTNPIANLINIPFQGNYDTHMNPDNTGHETYVKFQPVIPFDLNESWLLISRTIVPIIDQFNIMPGTHTQFGLGDTQQSFFFSPMQSTANGTIWGAGPIVQLPTGTQTLLGQGKWGLGPTAVVVNMTGPWTIGILANQVWSVAGPSWRPPVNQTYAQPFLSYTTHTAWTFTLNSESTYDWHASTLTFPLNATVTKLFRVGKLPISVGGGIRYWVTTPDTGPKDFGARLVITFLFPKT